MALVLSVLTIIISLTLRYALLNPHRSDRNIHVLNLICLLGLYLSFALPDWQSNSIHFLGLNFGTVS